MSFDNLKKKKKNANMFHVNFYCYAIITTKIIEDKIQKLNYDIFFFFKDGLIIITTSVRTELKWANNSVFLVDIFLYPNVEIFLIKK